jgi:hypothetical protein
MKPPGNGRIEIEALHGQGVEPGLPDLHLERRLRGVGDARLLLAFQILQRILHRFAPLGRFRDAVARGLHRHPVGFRLLDRAQPPSRLALVLDRGKQQRIGERAGAHRGERDEDEDVHDVFSIDSSALASRASSL